MPEVRRLGSSPRLGPLYVRAALPRLRRSERPDEALRLDGLRLEDVRPEVAHVAEYARLCGFRLSSWLPVTYPHVLAFPLQMALMADRRFPFRATGLVHVSNRIEARRPVPVGRPVDVSVRVTGPHPHPKGRTVDMLTTVNLDGEEAWTSASTYLRRGGAAAERADGSAPPLDVPADLPTTSVWRLPADLGRRYAAVSGDRNPIHLSPVTARLFGFSRPIAHGMWTSAACVAVLEGRLPDRARYEVEFKAAVPLPSTVEVGARLEDDGSADVVLRSARSGRLHLLGRVTPRSCGR